MLDQKDINDVDYWIGAVFRGATCKGWERIKKKNAEALKPSHNSAMLEIALVLREFLFASECEDSVGGNILINRINAVVTQLQQ